MYICTLLEKKECLYDWVVISYKCLRKKPAEGKMKRFAYFFIRAKSISTHILTVYCGEVMRPEFVRRMSTMWKGIHSSWMAGGCKSSTRIL